MNPEVFAEWFRRQRHRVVRTPSSYWFEASTRVYQAIPFHWTIRPEPGELAQLLRSARALALRCTTPLDVSPGRVSYHVVCDDDGYDLERLDGRTRRGVRQALQRVRVEPVSLRRLAEEGWALEVDTCQRQGREVPMAREAWRRKYLAAADLPGFEGWAALVGGRLAATLLSVRIDDWCELLSQQCLSEFLNARVNNALIFAFTREVLRRPGLRSILYTVESLAAPASVDEFKFRMGYAPRPVRQLVAFHPWAERLVGPAAQRLATAAARRRPGSSLVAKAEGMVRFHVQGKLPVAEQEWPACLEGARAQVVGGGAPSPVQVPAPEPAPRPALSPDLGPDGTGLSP